MRKAYMDCTDKRYRRLYSNPDCKKWEVLLVECGIQLKESAIPDSSPVVSLCLSVMARGVWRDFIWFLFPSHHSLLPPRALHEDDWGRVSCNPPNDWNPETKFCWQGVRNRQRRIHGSIYVSGKLITCPSPKPTFCPKREVSVNVSLWEG